MKNVYLIHGARTAFTQFGGSFARLSATELGVVTAREAIKRSRVKADTIDHVIYGNVIHTGENASYLARHIGLKAGVPEEVPAFIVNRLCGSGMQAIISAVHEIQLGEAEIVLAGGIENMSQSPYANFTQRFSGMKMGNLEFVDMLQATLTDRYTGSGMGLTAEKLAVQYEITRDEQDLFAMESNQRAAKAREAGIFAEEIVPVEVITRKGTSIIEQDEQIKPHSNIEALSHLKPAFQKDGTVTAGNASGINDGAASVIIASEAAVEKYGLTPLARIVSSRTVGVDPTVMGIGPVPAIQQVLAKSQLTLEEMDVIEINEAFAAQYLAVERVLQLDRTKTNIHGGAIALGHPVGASGTRIVLSAALTLKRTAQKYAIASLCIGGGQGIAMVIEHVQ